MSLAAKVTDRSTKDALQRVLCERAQMGVDEVREHGLDADLHALRKRIKELRGLLRLLRSGLPQAKALDTKLRDAARGLGQSRDLQVMLDQFDALTGGLRAPAHFSRLRALILDARAAREETDLVSAIATYSETLHQVTKAASDLSLSDKASHLMWRNLHKTYHRARQDQQRAETAMRKGFEAEPFHEWRKWVKRHWYQARFLEAIKPAKMTAHIAACDALGESLGDHNDLDVLMVFLDNHTDLPPEDQSAREIFRGHCLARRKALALEAIYQAKTVFRQSPDALAAKWQRWWRDWRDA
ncbi:MAG: CHAD domain-containing protein [Roseinatronobacter sp.]